MFVQLMNYTFYQNERSHRVCVYKDGKLLLQASCAGPLTEDDMLELLHVIQSKEGKL